MAEIIITLDGKIRGKGRPRFGQGFVHTDKETAAYEAHMAKQAKEQMDGREPLPVPLRIIVEAVFETPASWSPAARNWALAGTMPHSSRPDFDNILKAACDALNGIVWYDDAQIAEVSFKKRYGQAERIEIRVETILKPHMAADHPSTRARLARIKEQRENPAPPKPKKKRTAIGKPKKSEPEPIGRRIR